MTRRIGYGEDALAGPRVPLLCHTEDAIWTGTPHPGLAFDRTTFRAVIPAAALCLFYLIATLMDPSATETLAMAPIGPALILSGFLAYLAFVAMTIPGGIRDALSTESAFNYGHFPWQKLNDDDIGLTGPIDLRDTAIYFADKTVRHTQTYRHRVVGFRNISPAQAEAIHDMFREIQLKAVT